MILEVYTINWAQVYAYIRRRIAASTLDLEHNSQAQYSQAFLPTFATDDHYMSVTNCMFGANLRIFPNKLENLISRGDFFAKTATRIL